ncbi:MAG: hypothetical protein RXP97_02460 [Nitrososphaeria archaeon]
MSVVDDEERRILERIARALRTGTASDGREGAKLEVAAPIRGSDPGFYEYVPERDAWRLVSRGKWRPAEDGLYVVFHDSYIKKSKKAPTFREEMNCEKHICTGML